ncbi:MAG TPA: TIGR03085 family metal-binding protein [Pseudonocardiaceae bacterium]|nr:TIGR03085 family metal-binding protein [Pseudonocardiaceae bacterium]
MGIATDERSALSDLFDELGPDAATLCEGWQARDLAAHLVLRDRRPDAAAGIAIKAVAGRTERVQRTIAARPWAELVDQVRNGPPAWSPFRLPGLGDLVNGAEYFVHHEDLRRGQPDWEPRPADAARDEAVWKAARMTGRLAYRRSPVGVLLRRPDGAESAVHRGPDTVAIIGEPGELLLHMFGRDAVRVSFDGDQRSIAIVQGLDRAF